MQLTLYTMYIPMGFLVFEGLAGVWGHAPGKFWKLDVVTLNLEAILISM